MSTISAPFVFSPVPPPRHPSVIVQDRIAIPTWVDDLASFCRWAVSPDFPTEGHISYLASEIWVDPSMEEFLTHNQVKAAFSFAIMSLLQGNALGRFVPDRMLLVNKKAELSTEPDGLFYTWETMRSGKLRLVETTTEGFLQLDGTPDLVLEIVSKNSVRKDTVRLRDLYAKAGIDEYWLVDARTEPAKFDILQLENGSYQVQTAQEGWQASRILTNSFRIAKGTDPLGHPQFSVEVSPRRPEAGG